VISGNAAGVGDAAAAGWTVALGLADAVETGVEAVGDAAGLAVLTGGDAVTGLG
jgi:hypothetical protein